MRKVIASTLGFILAGTGVSTAFAVENQFGGYWRTRAYFQNEMHQDGDYYSADNRTRLYYTAKFSDDFKFVNKFEYNTIWGDNNGGDIGADGTSIFMVKNSYADFTVGSINTKLGIQGAILARGFLFYDDFSGIVVTPQFNNISMSLGYMAVRSKDGGGADFNEAIGFTKADVMVNENLSIAPYAVYWGAGNGQDEEGVAVGDWNAYYLGADIDLKFDTASFWGTMIYNGGKLGDGDINGFLVAAGAEAGLFHGQAFYASGDDNTADEDTNAFLSLPGQSYYWSEIMGYGFFDNTASTSSPDEKISNVAAINGGITLRPYDKVTLVGDVWYAMLAEKNQFGEDELGLEFDGRLTYALMDNLNADFILAYLVAGDATGDEDVFEGGVQVSLSF